MFKPSFFKGTDTERINAALQAAHDADCGLDLEGRDYCVEGIVIDNTNAPRFIKAEGARLGPSLASQEFLLKLSNTHYGFLSGLHSLSIRDLTLLGGGKVTDCLRVLGGQRMDIKVQCLESVRHGALIEADAGFGVYNNTFEINSHTSGDSAFKLISLDRMRQNSNVYRLSALVAGKHAIEAHKVQGLFVNPHAEVCGDAAFTFTETRDVTCIGGYSENNMRSGVDTSFLLDSTSRGVKILGGRHTGAKEHPAILPTGFSYSCSTKASVNER